MKVKKSISIILLSCLFVNTATPSFSGILSEDGRYETFKNSDITVNNVLEEDKADFKVEGNTLFNIAPLSELTKQSDNHGEITIKNDVYRITRTNTDMVCYLKLDLGNRGSMLKPNSLYTVILDDYKTSSVNGDIVIYDRTNTINASSRPIYKNGGVVIQTSDTIDATDLELLIYNIDGEIGSYVECSNKIMIFEGDLTENPPVEYIEGIESSFEDQLVTQDMVDKGQEKAENLGKYKVEVKSNGKNLLNPKLTEYNYYYKYTDGEVYMDSQYNSMAFYAKPNTEYSQSIPRNNITFWNNDIFLGGIANTTRFTTPDNCNLVKISVSVNKFDAQVEEGSIATEYEPYKESINTFYLNSPLLKGDTIKYINGQAYHVKKSEKILLDGISEEEWRLGPNTTNDDYIRFKSRITIPEARDSILNNRFANYSAEKLYNGGEMLWIHGIDKTLDIQILKSKLSTQDIAGFKQWLSENPITVVYELTKPIYEPIKADLSIQLFKETTHISNSSNVPATMEITVDRTLNRATEAVELAKTSSTTENISRARMWTNLLKESIIKDQLQGEVNSITEIEDLQLERKTVTSNMDLYVKSENMLSMTLSTNSITFDNYGGVDDIEKLDALEISINSSLPYSLNSYLVSEIQNSDGSSIIDRELFNIRESSQGEYKKFINIGEKLILKDDCEAGNNIVHDIDMKLEGSNAHKADIYKTVIKFEAEQK